MHYCRQAFIQDTYSAQAARVLSVRISTLANWRCAKCYDLHYLKVGSRIYYPADALIAFLDRQTR
ncbi:helix-turn-helix domain-containing protein [Agarivorans sp. Alg241-V36]|uniref:helix-turn-helix domain-containing protein n=1 Tax=Agarivorans sp. Alg241-V36 TaxID=2305992 RepID=UPI00351BCFE2